MLSTSVCWHFSNNRIAILSSPSLKATAESLLKVGGVTLCTVGLFGALGNTRLGAKCSELSQETYVLILMSLNSELGDGGWEIPSIGTELLSARYGGEKGLWDVYHLFQVLGHSHEDSCTPLFSLIAQGPLHLASTFFTITWSLAIESFSQWLCWDLTSLNSLLI